MKRITRSPATTARPGPHALEVSSPLSIETSTDSAPRGQACCAQTAMAAPAMISPAFPSLVNEARSKPFAASTVQPGWTAVSLEKSSSWIAGAVRRAGGAAGGWKVNTTCLPGGGHGRSRDIHSSRFLPWGNAPRWAPNRNSGKSIGTRIGSQRVEPLVLNVIAHRLSLEAAHFICHAIDVHARLRRNCPQQMLAGDRDSHIHGCGIRRKLDHAAGKAVFHDQFMPRRVRGDLLPCTAQDSRASPPPSVAPAQMPIPEPMSESEQW